MADAKVPLSEPCPECNESDCVYRDYSSVSLTYDILDVQTRAAKVGGSGFTDVMKAIKKGAGKGNNIRV
jgi:hypothetical protein